MTEVGNRSTELRSLLARKNCLVVPGCHDALSAKMIEAAGFPAVYLSSYCIQACGFGAPNIGFPSLREQVDYARNIANAIGVPLIADAATGFGDALDVRRTVREFESAGVAGINIEDQTRTWSPHAQTKTSVLPVELAATKIRAAKDAQRSSDFVVIAPTYSMSLGVEESIMRGNAYAEAGADLIKPMISPFLPYSGSQTTTEVRLELLRRLVSEIHSPVVTHCPHGLDFEPNEVEATGIKLYVIPQFTLGPAAAAVRDALTAFQERRLAEHYVDRPPHPVKALSALLGLGEYDDLARRYRVHEPPMPGRQPSKQGSESHIPQGAGNA